VKRYALLILFISLAFFPFSILKCEVQDSIGIDSTKSIDSTEIFDSTKSISQRLHEKFDTAYVGTNAENIKEAFHHFIVGGGVGYYFGDDRMEKFTNKFGYLWNFDIELLLDARHLWSLEFTVFDNETPFEETISPRGVRFFSLTLNRYFSYSENRLYPGIHLGLIPFFPFFLYLDVGGSVDYYFWNSFIVSWSFRKIFQYTGSFETGRAAKDYSPFIFNLELRYQL